MPRWGSQPTRHYKTTTTRRGNTTYRTVQSRGTWGGSYAPPSKAQKKFFGWFFGLLFGIAILLWPFYRLHGTAEAIVGPIWVVVVWGGAFLLIRHRLRSKKAAVSTTTKPPSVAPRAVRTTVASPVASPTPTASDQANALQKQVERLTREVEAAKKALQELQAKQTDPPAQT